MYEYEIRDVMDKSDKIVRSAKRRNFDCTIYVGIY